MTTSDPTASRLTLRLSFDVVTAVKVLPRNRVHLSGIVGDALSARLVLRRDDGEPLEVTGISLQDARLVVTSERLTEARKIGALGALPGDIVVSVAALPEIGPTSANGRMQIGTNHPEAATIDVVYSLRVRPLIEHRPAQLRLVLERGNRSGRTMLGRLQHNRRAAFTIRSVQSSAPAVFTATPVDGEIAKPVHTVAVMLDDDVQPGAFTGRRLEHIIVTTDDAKQPEITIPVLLEARESRSAAAQRPSG